MDILDRIVEAVAQKLISIRLEENKYSYSEIPDTGNPNAGKKSGSSNPKNPAPKPEAGPYGRSGADKQEVKPLTKQQAGASGGERARTGDISKGPNKEKVKKTPVRPVRNDNDSKKGGQEAGRGGNLAAVTAHFRKTRGNK
jgi:hypothetical protein